MLTVYNTLAPFILSRRIGFVPLDASEVFAVENVERAEDIDIAAFRKLGRSVLMLPPSLTAERLKHLLMAFLATDSREESLTYADAARSEIDTGAACNVPGYGWIKAAWNAYRREEMRKAVAA